MLAYVFMEDEKAKRVAPVVQADEPHEPELGTGLEQIREILFGPGHRDLQRRLGRVDAQLGARLRELEQETRRRLELIESHLKKETEALTGQLTELEQKLSRIEEASQRGQRELRQQLLDQGKTFLDEIKRLRTDLLARIHEELNLTEVELPESPRAPEGHRPH